MDPFVSDILKRSAVIAGGIAAIGLLLALAYGLLQYSQLQHAMTLRMAPPQLP
jgi:hypothetical protein